MKLTFFIFTFLFILFEINISQNLVPNQSFEEFHDLPSKQGDYKMIKNWFVPYKRENTPDYFHRKAKDPRKYSDFVGVPKNTFGFQEAKTGDAYIGLFLWKDSEIIGCELKEELRNDKFYNVTFYVSLKEAWFYAIDNIGVYFSQTKIRYADKDPFDKKYKEQKYKFNPQIISQKEKPIEDKENWTKISGTFKAKGGEKYMYLGCFASLSDITVKRLKKRTFRASYYYDDDISVYELDSLVNPITIEPEINTLINVKDTLITEIENKKIGESIILKIIQFEFDKSDLLPNSYNSLDNLFEYLKLRPNVKIEISGHTDNTGNEERNKELSEQRAKAVFDYLTKKGISKERLRYKGYGNLFPVNNNITEENREKNRRVELKIISK